MAAATPCSLTQVSTETEFDERISQLPPSCLAVIYFHAPWAEPCKQMNTILSTLASTYESGTPPRIVFFSLDAEELSDISERYDVTQVPFIVMQKAGKVLESVTGTDATKVRAAVERHAGGSAATGLPPAQKVNKQSDSQQAPQTNGGSVAKGTADASGTAQTTNGVVDAEQTKEQLNQRLSDLVKAAPVMLFMKGTPSAPQCGFSRQLVGMLRERGVRYGFFNILADDEVRQGLKDFSDWPTFPQLYVDGDFVGGLDIVKEEFENDSDFLNDYSVHNQAKQGDITASARQAQTA